MPLDQNSPGFVAAIDGFIADVETLMREKLKGIGDYKNLADIESEIDRLTLRIEILGPDPEFQEVSKRMDLKRQDITRKRDQMKPFLLKLERELSLYQAAKANAAGVVAAPVAPVVGTVAAPAPVAAAAAPVAPAWAPAPGATPQPAAPVPSFAPAPARPMPPPAVPTARAPAPPPPVAPEWPEPAAPVAAPAIDMSLPEDDGGASVSFISPATDFITGPGVDGTADLGEAELMLDVPAAPPAAAQPPVTAAAQWPPPGQNIPDPFAAFQPAAKPAAAPPAAAAPRPGVPVAAPAAPRAPGGAPPPVARPAGAPAAAPPVARPAAPPAAAPAGTKPPPWQK